VQLVETIKGKAYEADIHMLSLLITGVWTSAANQKLQQEDGNLFSAWIPVVIDVWNCNI
jgi:hypothetical protein